MIINSKILNLEKFITKIENLQTSFDYIKITLASPNRIKSWSARKLPNGLTIGEVLVPETVSTETFEPEINGLFCEKIFGPLKSWECKCGKYKGLLFNKICEECNVEIIDTKVRRYRMGYIELYCPIAHPWYINSNPNYLTLLLNLYNSSLKTSDVQKIIYFAQDKITAKIELKLYQTFLIKQALQQNELSTFYAPLDKQIINLKGADLLKTLLEGLNLDKEIKELRTHITLKSLQILNNIDLTKKFKRLRILESFKSSKTNPGWMMLTILPILPPNLRPIYEIENGKLILNDINELYKTIIERNRYLFNLKKNYTNTLNLHHRRLLQESIDLLIDKKHSFEKYLKINKKKIKSLTDILKGKHGRFRQSLLGKRVDYSGRSIIIVGPNLRLNQCGLPYKILKELFQPHLLNELFKLKLKNENIKFLTYLIKQNKPIVWALLVKLIKKYSILLNRAPTLHRFGIQAFDPVLVLGNIISLHPLVCAGFNADFDGDQMAVHLPLYEISQLEIRTMMRPSYNILSPANGEVILKPTQDMVIGCYYLTLLLAKFGVTKLKIYCNELDVLSAFFQKKLSLHTSILVQYTNLNSKITINNNTIVFSRKLMHPTLNEKKISIYKRLKKNKDSNMFYLITNIGILICILITNNSYILQTAYLETSPGRIIFNTNFKNSLLTT
jgi:DNA-directed RNA polymerase subunit beta'